MCRHLVCLGPERTVASAVTQGGHSLARQAWAPEQMRGGGTINADGFGACWWAAGGVPGVGQHRTTLPIWSDPALGRAVAGDGDGVEAGGGGAAGDGTPAVRGTLEQIRATAILAAVRSATPGMAVSAQACAPFTDGRWAFSHNGVIRGWPDTVAGLADAIPAAEVMRGEAATDSVFLWQLFRARITAGMDAADAAASLVRDVEERAPGSRLNLLATDGGRVVATAWRHSLWVLDAPDELWIASEPITDVGWAEVDDGVLVDARVGRVQSEPIPIAANTR
ncbi:ergothioneine biosynthesis protein EgtC [Tomitella fengzijianii]|uniref:Ergothioneine biosynthesis protein EgtC n=1 Tax=Tomitella fengzijianii TaxID=2597660 RepID=A0A516X1W8_9ACTN|nr:ergothioneine biosynthesis protein EgtC [Tomitella fengzijianii]QDQ97069.1 ergothioneine biosynthesis protein EgtC [Tomitella fengzijianii]